MEPLHVLLCDLVVETGLGQQGDEAVMGGHRHVFHGARELATLSRSPFHVDHWVADCERVRAGLAWLTSLQVDELACALRSEPMAGERRLAQLRCAS
jgi:hypothetical protein